jgi:hypothetical protein
MDHQLAGNEGVTEALLATARGSRALLPLTSPGYRRSNWCQWELGKLLAAIAVVWRWAAGVPCSGRGIVTLPTLSRYAWPMWSFGACRARRTSGPTISRRTGRTHIPALGVLDSVAEALLNHVKGEIETYNLYNYWPERKHALGLWHEKLLRLEE